MAKYLANWIVPHNICCYLGDMFIIRSFAHPPCDYMRCNYKRLDSGSKSNTAA